MGDRSTAIQFYNQGVAAATAQPPDLQMAYKLFTSACHMDPSFGMAWYAQGNHNFDLKLYRAAICCYRKALQAELPDPDRAKALVNLGWSLHTVGECEEAEHASRQGVDLDPSLACGWANLGTVESHLGNSILAVEHAMRGHKL